MGEGWGGAGAAGLALGGAAACAVMATVRNANDANELVTETGNAASPNEPEGIMRFFDDSFGFARRLLGSP